MSRLQELVTRLRSYASQPCIEDGDRSCTYASLLDAMDRWTTRLEQMSVTSGSVVGLRADYSLDAVAALLALFLRQNVVALIPRQQAPETYLQEACVTTLLEISTGGEYESRVVAESRNHELLDRLRAAGDAGIVIFTSGATGRPKAALQSVERFLGKFRNQGHRLRTVAFLLLDHVAGLDTLFYTLANGGSLVFIRRRDPEAIQDAIERHRAEVLPVSPSFLRLLCAAEQSRPRDLSSLKIITYGSELMDPATLARLSTRFPNARIVQKYGTTETGSPRTVSRDQDSLWLKIKSDGVETKVVDGILWLRGEGTMLGYLNAPSPLDADGWYCTGDLVDVDGEWIRFRGRATEIINVGGEKVAPVEVEQTILELDIVRHVVVSGLPHPLVGNAVMARVVLSADTHDQRDAARAIRSHCRRRLTSHKVPVKIEFVTEDLLGERHKLRRH